MTTVNRSHDAKRRIVALEAAAFLLVLIVLWLNELIDLPHLLFGAPRVVGRAVEATLESACVLLVFTGVVVATVWLFNRIERLESYVVLCAWCRKVKVDDRWVTFEEFLSEKGKVETSHGLCESCAEEQYRLIQIPRPEERRSA